MGSHLFFSQLAFSCGCSSCFFMPGRVIAPDSRIPLHPSLDRARRGLENAFREQMPGCWTPLSRVRRGPETLSAATRYATG